MSVATGLSSMGGMTGNIIPKGYKMGQIQQFTPEQMNLFKNLFSQVSPDSFTSRLAGGDEGAFAQMEAPAMRQFGGLQGGIASRFSGMGSFGARRSSGFQNEMSQASQEFAERLQAQRMGLQRQALQDLMSMSSQLLGQRPYETSLIKQDPSIWMQLLSGLGGMAGQAGGRFGGMGLSKLAGLI